MGKYGGKFYFNLCGRTNITGKPAQLLVGEADY